MEMKRAFLKKQDILKEFSASMKAAWIQKWTWWAKLNQIFEKQIICTNCKKIIMWTCNLNLFPRMILIIQTNINFNNNYFKVINPQKSILTNKLNFLKSIFIKTLLLTKLKLLKNISKMWIQNNLQIWLILLIKIFLQKRFLQTTY